jgi:hypothetical protein
METLLIAASSLAYLGLAVTTARKLFSRWRPSLSVVRCIREYRDYSGTVRKCPDAYGRHGEVCYRQHRRGERLPFDTLSQAWAAASAAGLLWWLVLLVLTVVVRTPELPSERKEREEAEVEARKAELAELDGQLEASRKALERPS